ncbi:hypothetical protein C8Q77DRAFT_1160102 [Trametes polyzona]|nr:hypothetical protein C8Q77DRAFT_1160102 [Trametes polyzona]
MDAQPENPHPPFSLDKTLGAVFIGHIVTVLSTTKDPASSRDRLYGITSLQAAIYSQRSSKDSFALKCSVLLIWVLDTLHAVLISGASYWYCVTNFTNMRAVDTPVWPIPLMIVVSNASNSIVRGIFGYHLWELSNRNWILPTVVALCSIVVYADAMYFAIELFSLPSYRKVPHYSWTLYLGLSAEAAGDLFIALSQSVLLHRLSTGMLRSDMIVKTLIKYSISTGLLTSLCAIAALLSFSIAPTNFVYFAFYFIISKLYVNALLARLNARGPLLESMNGQRGRQILTDSSTLAFRTAAGTVSIPDSEC